MSLSSLFLANLACFNTTLYEAIAPMIAPHKPDKKLGNIALINSADESDANAKETLIYSIK
ncbi:hypothetical protein [Nitrosomonas sp. sh817]|uniref:hypothetical protein n=1 Tax=Nitrosomonas sp. sh817 TaxID=3070658 RepID=UPI0027DDA331|nr:hypothetical protein [Nitrosomonas sp. sh817]WMJ08581.1 hypothetical protein RBH92_14325 [Nitrosomonas sp. sh817]